jgi:hypothetical protein
MNRIRMMALLALFLTGRAGADDLVGTNRMPLAVHNLMKTDGYALSLTNRDLAPLDTDSLRMLPPIKFNRLTLFKPVSPKSPWSFWQSSHVKYVGLNRDPMNYLAPQHLQPYTVLNQLEYDIIYSFDF